MSANSAIEWTDHTFNIAWGCVKVSPGCEHCYALTLSKRYGHNVWGPAKTTPRRTFGANHWREPVRWNAAAEREGVRKRVFCGSMCDVFEDHPTVTAEREKLWPLIRATPWLDWQLLTKRPERIEDTLPEDWDHFENGYPNAWLGTSFESQDYVWRVRELSLVPAVVHFISAEPLLAPLDLTGEFQGLSAQDIWWLIVGGESGPGCSEMELSWAASLRDQAWEYDVLFFLKQLGGHPNKRGHEQALLDGVRHVEMPAREVFA